MFFLVLCIIGLVIYLIRAIVKYDSVEETIAFRAQLQKEQAQRKLETEQKVNAFVENLPDCFKKAVDDKIAKYIVLDFETSDLPMDYKVPADVSGYFPYALSVAALVFNEAGDLIEEYDNFIKVPATTFIHPAAFKVNNITVEDCQREGVDISDFFNFLLKYIRMDTFLVAHNVQFENYFLKLEARRNNIKLPKYLKFCTMAETKSDLCLYKDYGRGFKNPNLKELVAHAFFQGADITITNTHNAFIDAKLCALCFFKLNLNKRCV